MHHNVMSLQNLTMMMVMMMKSLEASRIGALTPDASTGPTASIQVLDFVEDQSDCSG